MNQAKNTEGHAYEVNKNRRLIPRSSKGTQQYI